MKQGLRRRLEDMEHEKRRAQSVQPFISTSGNISASILLRFITFIFLVFNSYEKELSLLILRPIVIVLEESSDFPNFQLTFRSVNYYSFCSCVW